jgi:hypothetical protein
MNSIRTLSKRAAVAAMAGLLLVPAVALARGGGGFGGGGFRGAVHGPVFGFPRARIAHPALAHGFARRWPARIAAGFHQWNFHRFALRHGNGGGNAWGAAAPFAGDAGAYAVPADVTGTLGGPGPTAVFAPPAPASYPPEHVGCQARGYDVPAESGGVAKVVVTRC